MSCSVKISSAAPGKGWSGSQRRINALQEEGAPLQAAMNASASCPSLGQMPQQQQQTQLSPQKLAAQQVQAPLSPRPVKCLAAKRGEETSKLLRYIDDNLIGKNVTFLGPFGRRKVVYCDYTATGRSLQFLEDYIMKEVLPYLGDTRSSTTICSLQSSLFRHEARDIVRHAVGAGEQDAVLFAGQGTAGALRALLRHLDLGPPTTVFVGPFEHHANLRPWREHAVRLVRIDETREGFLDLNDLERKLMKERAENPASKLIGYFSAASCITGVLADDVATTLLLRQHGALSIWDYTSAAPYVKMEMNPNLPGVGETTVHKDAIIFSGHKFIGGAQSPGVLVVKRSLLSDDVSPEDMRDSHRYLRDPELREESGTSGVVETIRCGLAVQLKENLTHQAIASRQDKISKQVLSHVRTIPELILLGCSSQNVKRLPTFSFMVRHPRGTFLHHNFVVAILNDVFGVQARGGCACAGSYAHDLMGIDEKLAKEYEALLLSGSQSSSSPNRDETNAETLRPGFARLTFSYFMSETEVAFVLEALKMVATEGWKLLPQYVVNPETGEWRHHTNSVFKDRRWLGSIRYTDGRMSATERRVSGPGVFPQSHADCLQTARNTFNRARKMAQRYPTQIDRSVTFEKKGEALRWFMLPHEAQDLLLGHSQNVKQQVPFDPSTYKLAQLEASCFGIRRLNSDVPRTGNPPVSPNSPRHRSLPALSCPADIRKARCSTRSNTDTEDDEMTGLGQKSPATCPGSPMPTIRFAVGEAVTTAAVGILGSAPTVARLISGEQQTNSVSPQSNGVKNTEIPAYVARARCNSLGSTSRVCGNSGGTSSPVPIPLSPQTLASLGIATANTPSRHRHCSCSSQTELNGSLESDANGSPGRSASSLGHVPTNSPAGMCSSSFDSVMSSNRFGRSSPVLLCGMSHRSEDDLRAYLKEVTKELATEIKSEIREVISKVDDALSEKDASDLVLHHPRAPEKQQHHDSFSASDIAEYLMEFSKEMASEVKSEIRCMVSSVDGLHRYSPDDKPSSGCASPSERRRITISSTASPRARPSPIPVKLSELAQNGRKMSSECSSDETVIYVMKSTPTNETATEIVDGGKSNVSNIGNNTDDDDEGDHSEQEKALPKIYSTVNSVSSQDSGINMSFQESDRSVDGSVPELGRSSSAESNSNGSCCMRRPRFSNASSGNTLTLSKQSRAVANDDLSEDDEIFFSVSQQQVHSENSSEASAEDSGNQWHCPPKNIWKPTVEAMQEFEMIKDNDRVLLCLASLGRSSLSLLHTLHQYRFYARSKGIDFEIGAASVTLENYDPVAIEAYLKMLNVPYYYEELGKDSKVECNASDGELSKGSCTSFCEKTTRAKLYALAKKNNYNVLALGQNLDDLTEGFLSSVFNNGKLRTMKAHYYIREQELRVIRPFVYVREKALKQFADGKKIPVFAVTPVAPEEETGQKKSEELINRQETSYPRLYWSLRSALRPLISAQTQSVDSEQPQKRQQHRRPRTYSFSGVPLTSLNAPTCSLSGQQRENSDETDEEPVL